jgi:hypothetical protein
MDRDHRQSDLQSLLLTAEAVRNVRSRPELVKGVLATLDHWDRVAAVDSKPLRDAWRDIIASGQWARALAPDEQGQQLCQASPLGRALPAERRREIIRTCKGRNSNT